MDRQHVKPDSSRRLRHANRSGLRVALVRLESGYQRMAMENVREADALAWAEATIGDVDAAPESNRVAFISLQRRVRSPWPVGEGRLARQCPLPRRKDR